jgi:hypothetical protein
MEKSTSTFIYNYISYTLQRPYDGAILKKSPEKPTVFLKITPRAICEKLFWRILTATKEGWTWRSSTNNRIGIFEGVFSKQFQN